MAANPLALIVADSLHCPKCPCLCCPSCAWSLRCPPQGPACWEGWVHPQLSLYLGSLWFKRSFSDETAKNEIFIQTLPPSLCAPRTVREKRCFFLSFSLWPRRAKLPCADTRQAAQQRTKLLSVVLLPAIHVPAAGRRQPRTLPAVLQPFPWGCGALAQGLRGRGCSPPPVQSSARLSAQAVAALLSEAVHPRRARRESDGPGRLQHASPKQTNPGSCP